MDTGDLLAVIRARHGTEYQADDPILVAKTIVEVLMAEEREKTRAMLDGTEIGKTAGAVKEMLARVEDASVTKLADRASPQIANAIDRAVELLARADRRKNLLYGTLGAAALILVAGAGGWWAGRDAGRAEASATAADLRAEFADGAEGAAIWRDLIKFNRETIQRAAASCERIADASGRPACSFALWTGPALPAPAKAKP